MNIRLALVTALALSVFAACHGASARQFHVLYSFCAKPNCGDGQSPQSGLVADSQGNLYGTTTPSGVSAGLVYELARSHGGWSYQVLHAFCSAGSCADGFDPRGGLIIDTAGNLYGTTVGQSFGSTMLSTIYELSPDATRQHWTFRTLHTFCQLNRHGERCRHQWSYAISALTYAGQASGVPYDGRSPLYGYEEIFYTSGSKTEVVYRYSGNHGFSRVADESSDDLSGDPELGNDGSLYGTKAWSGQFQHGTVFALNPATGAETVLHDFCAQPQCSDGEFPLGLMFDPVGNVYGNAGGGSPTSYCLAEGFDTCGVIYKLTPQVGQYGYSILQNLCGKPNCSDGAGPQYSLIHDTAGTLYGVAERGGGNAGTLGGGGGTVFEANAEMERALHKFCSEANCADGEFPNGPVLMDAKGNLYGTTAEGGAYFDPTNNVLGGTIFEITR
jgi:uncharacterized repeat protein (TIGR03803 family)